MLGQLVEQPQLVLVAAVDVGTAGREASTGSVSAVGTVSTGSGSAAADDGTAVGAAASDPDEPLCSASTASTAVSMIFFSRGPGQLLFPVDLKGIT